MRLKDKRAIVTAAASGMGAAGCKLFAQEGATVAVVDIHPERTQAVVDEILAAGGKARGFIADLSRPEECGRVIREAADWLGGLDLLWAHAGTPGPAQFEEMEKADYDFTVNLNLTSAVQCAAAAGPLMRQRGGGSILFTSSVGGLVGSMMAPIYSMAKFGVIGLTMSLAQRYAADGIRVNAICPGPVDTPMLPLFFGRKGDEDKTEENRQKLMAIVPMGRAAQPIEIAHGALWLLSDDASFVTGIALPVDGGYTCR